jgi:hypothetical protein
MIRKTENKKHNVVKMEKMELFSHLVEKKLGGGERKGKKEIQEYLKKTTLTSVVFVSLLTSSMDIVASRRDPNQVQIWATTTFICTSPPHW